MSEVIIKAEHISKQYRLGTVGTGALRQDIKLWWQSKVLKQKNDFFQVGDEIDDTSKSSIWALKDVNFEIKEGEVWGMIGRNGAGKSTLLKILSRIIRPTKGTVKGRGKVSSLLEVGTGFHHDLTGRENIYISGYMLGMRKAEIEGKFDEIVDFSGIEQFIDTPVKRYSSGMYVRLAFAVAAHLEPDILIVDEVLAVGDAEFQKKSMGKMKDVSRQKGRTIIFVSHNLQAVNNLCEKAIWLQKGSVVANADAQTVVNGYLNAYQKKLTRQEWLLEEAPGNAAIRVLSVELIPHLANPLDVIDIRTPLTVRFRFCNFTDNINLMTGLHLFTQSGECIFDVSTEQGIYNKGVIEGECEIPGHFLNDGSYYFSIIFVKDSSEDLYYLEECLHFEVEDFRENINWYGKWQGYVRPKFPFQLRPAHVKTSA
jgi:lipopolysaccharide transport system ATP-binding protein